VDTVHECDRQTDRQTDRRTDRITITKTVQRRASHGKNENVIHRAEHDIVINKQPISESGGILCLGSASEDGLSLHKFQVCARTKKAIVAAWHNYHKRSLTETNGGVALKT